MERPEQGELWRRPGFFSSLVYQDYRRLWIATACGQAALWALVVLRGALVYELTHSNAWVGFVTMAAHLPSLIVTPFAGLLADRFERRNLLALTYSLNLGVSVLLACLVVSGQVTEFHVLVWRSVTASSGPPKCPRTRPCYPILCPASGSSMPLR